MIEAMRAEVVSGGLPPNDPVRDHVQRLEDIPAPTPSTAKDVVEALRSLWQKATQGAATPSQRMIGALARTKQD